MTFVRLLCAALALAAFPALAQKTQLLVYTALETDQLKAYEQGFYREVNDVEIRWVRDSTGVVTAKLLAEKANPQADMILGLAATSLLVLEQEGMLTPYA
ncbi:MAG TPA: putative 2-aminoethylphosphonate ABC transporter substrate-binding protein, partial [Burkholderiales bacterium]|nr:putative 2-aminoethylphosphonate ABC transporter substrate-binding protein [Burkholderiales bacterium]